jgi:hypothetical protein
MNRKPESMGIWALGNWVIGLATFLRMTTVVVSPRRGAAQEQTHLPSEWVEALLIQTSMRVSLCRGSTHSQVRVQDCACNHALVPLQPEFILHIYAQRGESDAAFFPCLASVITQSIRRDLGSMHKPWQR